MECPRCGEELHYGTRFCPSCGLVVEDLVQELVEQEEALEEESALKADAGEGTPLEEDGSAKDALDEGTPEDDAAPKDEDELDAELEELVEQETLSDKTDVDDSEYAEEASVAQENSDGEGNVAESVESQEEGREYQDDAPEPNSEPVAEAAYAPMEDDASDSSATRAPRADLLDDGPAEGANAEQVASKGAGVLASIKRFVRDHKRLCAVACAIVATLLVVGIVLLVRGAGESQRMQEEQAARERALNTALPVAVTLDIDGYQEEHMTPIPLRVKGKSVSGKDVDEVYLVTPKHAEISMLPGSYGISLEGRPVSDEGIVYDGSVDTFTVEVATPEQPAESKEATGSKKQEDKDVRNPVFVFVPIAPENVRDADVDALRAWMKTAGIGNAESYIDAVLNRRNEALERLEQEQAAREEEELKKVEDTTRQIQEQIKNGQKRQNSSSSSQTSNQQNGSTYGNGSGTYGSTDEDGYGSDVYGSYSNYYGQSDTWGY